MINWIYIESANEACNELCVVTKIQRPFVEIFQQVLLRLIVALKKQNVFASQKA